MDNEIENIKKDIEKTGLPTEIKATLSLMKEPVQPDLLSNWYIRNQHSYFDEKEEKIFSIDILAILSDVRERDQRWELFKQCKLYIECKKSDKYKWVFYTRPHTIASIELILRQTSMQIQLAREYNPIPFSNIPRSYHTMQPPIGISYQIALGDKNPERRRDDFHKAQIQVLKSIYYGEKETSEKLMIIPVIIYEGGMYSYDIIKKTSIINKVEYIRYLSQGIPELPLPTYIDIVDVNFFPHYLELLRGEFTKFSASDQNV